MFNKVKIIISSLGGVNYSEGNRHFIIHSDWREPLEKIALKNIESWDPPYEDEEISLNKKQEILKNIEKAFLSSSAYKEGQRIEFDYSIENAFLSYKEIIKKFDFINSLLRYEPESGKNIFNELTAYFFVILNEYVKKSSRDFYYLDFDEKMKFKDEMDEDLQSILKLFINSKLNKDMSQKDFTYGLYALDMLLKNSNREEIKRTLKSYLDIGKECNLHHDDIMNKSNSYLAELIKEVEKTL